MEITAQMQANQAIGYMQAQTTQLAVLEGQISSGISLQKPSDNPANFVTLMGDKAQNVKYSTYLSTINDANNDLNTGVTALTNINSIITQANQIAQQGINASTDASGLPALASQANALLSSLVSEANTQSNGRYLFGGTASSTPPFAVTAKDASGNPTAITYQGSNDQGQTLIGPNQTVSTLYSGSGILQQPGADLFQTLMNIRDDLNNTNLSQNQLSTDLTQQFSALQQAQTNVQGAMGEQSASLQNLSSLQSQLQQLQLDNQTTTSNLESTDYTSAIVQLNSLQNVFQATLLTSSKIFNQSLLNFIQ